MFVDIAAFFCYNEGDEEEYAMKKKLIAILTVFALIILAGGSVFGYMLYQKYSEGTERADLASYYELPSSDKGAVMMDGSILEDNCRVMNGICYLDIATVQEYLHNRFYYTEVSREVRYTDAATVVVAPLDQSTWTSTTAGQTESFEEEYLIAFRVEDTCYIALDFVEKYVPVTHQIFSEPDRVVINSMESCKEMAEVKKDTAVRWRAGVKSDILTEVSKGDRVMILDAEQVEGWTKVATANGLIGYVKNSRLGDREMVTTTSTLEYIEPEYTSIQLNEKVRLGFHAVYNQTANGNLDQVLETAYNINVISPTWFALNDNVGNFTNIASEAYVQKAHDRGIQVWGLVEDISYDVDVYEILANSDTRTHLIEGLISAATAYDLDGLNIDFEGIRKNEGAHFVQFLRELSIRCREEGLILSVDNYPPNSGNTYYDYEEQGIIADYVVLMNYDEHWGGSGDPGSTSSQPFFERSIENLLELVDASKVINALPFYTRLWKTSGQTVTDNAVIMKAMDKNVSDFGMVIEYDEEAGQKYASAESNGVLYQMWIEDYASLENKLAVVAEKDLAGVAAWRLGYEEQAAWELIGNYIK